MERIDLLGEGFSEISVLSLVSDFTFMSGETKKKRVVLGFLARGRWGNEWRGFVGVW